MTHPPPLQPTGEQYEIRSGDHRAVITEVGATLRSFRVGDRDVVRGFGADEVVHGGRGQQLLPWPNRIRDGRYVFEGGDQQLALTEPDRHNAIHGLVRHVPWILVEHAEDRIEQRVRVFPQPGWPGTVEATLRHSVSAAGLLVEVTVTNVGSAPVPFGYAAHPYLTVGEQSVDEVALTVPAGRYLEVDDRLLPLQLRPVNGTTYDLRAGDPVAEVNLDTAFTDLAADDGRWVVRLELGDRWAELWAEAKFGWLQVYTGADRRDQSIAVEPMTCGPDAFNPGITHDDVIVLQPGDSFAGQWGVRGA
ncbi:aldose 1-epimerase family protein [Microlunatus speluncae]|uniref:aldose 1-epimerase family protein n=1 Tax=Microlunatus speluncae TaxID=2594267 RepID=UPI001FE3358F|nr:aldose 1-epimerase family protein [Microlunatus speluncae]